MQVTVQLAPELEARLASEAQARGLALESYIVEKLESPHSAAPVENRAVTQAIENLRALRKGNTLEGASIKDLVHEGHKY